MPFHLSLQSYFNRDTLEELEKLNLDPTETIDLIHAISVPQEYYNLRVNLVKINKENLLKTLRAQGISVKDFLEVPELIGIPIIRNPTLPRADRVVYANKYAAESVSAGANLFLPGVGPYSHQPLGVQVEIREWDRKIHVGTGITRVNLKKPPSPPGIAVETNYSPFRTWAFRTSEEYRSGLLDDQSLPPVCAVHCLMDHYQPGMVVFDLCAAPGGKTCAIAQIGRIKSGAWPSITAVDRSKNRLERLIEKIYRLGFEGITPIALKLEKIHTLKPEWKEKADLILLDPPCSALGTRPKIYIDTPAERYRDYPENQFRLVQHAWELLKPGGYMLYNTCTLTIAENEDLVARILTKFEAELVPAEIMLGSEGLPHPALSPGEIRNLKRFWPHRQDSIGYFIAVFRRTG